MGGGRLRRRTHVVPAPGMLARWLTAIRPVFVLTAMSATIAGGCHGPMVAAAVSHRIPETRSPSPSDMLSGW
jgi:hypothetical protein